MDEKDRFPEEPEQAQEPEIKAGQPFQAPTPQTFTPPKLGGFRSPVANLPTDPEPELEPAPAPKAEPKPPAAPEPVKSWSPEPPPMREPVRGPWPHPGSAPTPPVWAEPTPPPPLPKQQRNRSIMGPLLLVFVGLYFLLQNMGLVHWSIFEVFYRFWPIWLIAVGIDMLFGRRGRWGGLLALAIALTLLGGGVFFAQTWFTPQGSVWAHENAAIGQELGSAKEARVEITTGVSRLTLTGGAGDGMLAQGTISTIPSEEIRESFNIAGPTAHYSLKSQANGPRIGGASAQFSGRWDLALNDQIPIALTLSTGVGQSYIDLSALKITDLRVTAGVGETELILPAKGSLRGRIQSGVGQVSIRIPEFAAARIRVQNGLGGVSVRDGFEKDGNYYITPGYNSATEKIDLEISGGVGQIRISRDQ